MTDPLPADVRELMEEAAKLLDNRYRETLARYPKLGPAWQPGDVELSEGMAWLLSHKRVWWAANGSIRAADPPADAQPLFVGGRRVYPAHFKDYAKKLLEIADNELAGTASANRLRVIAAGINPEVPDE